MNEQWTKLEEFPAYEMNTLGDVRWIRTKAIIKVFVHGNSVVFHLRRDGKRHNRSVDKLYFDTFGEHLP